MKKVLLAFAVVSMLGSAGMSHAAVNVESSPPGAAVNSGAPSFTFGVGAPMVAVKSAPFTYANLDPLASHNMVADKRVNGKPVFTSALISVGQTENVDISKLVVGQTYGFHCTAHAWMKGSLTVQA
ncbi:MAG: hypothetical protein NVSMB57_07850 [Actinomycetota bacterium]